MFNVKESQKLVIAFTSPFTINIKNVCKVLKISTFCLRKWSFFQYQKLINLSSKNFLNKYLNQVEKKLLKSDIY